MTETKSATCATCPWWAPIASEHSGRCHHAASADDTYKQEDWWCSEHPDRRLPDVHELAARFRAELIPVAHPDATSEELACEAYAMADTMVAEAKRRRGE